MPTNNSQNSTCPLSEDCHGGGNALLTSVLRGDVPRIESVGILAAANPGDQPLTATENKLRFQGLRRDLIVYGMRQVRGRYKEFVHPLIVANVARTTLISLGKKYGQPRVIFGQRESREEVAMRFELLELTQQNGDAEARVNGVRRLSSQAHGHTANTVGDPDLSGVKPFAIPGFESSGDKDDPEFRGARLFSYRREDIPRTPEAQEVLARFLALDRLLVETLRRLKAGEGIAGSYLYHKRGDQNLRLGELHRLMGNWERFPIFSEDTW